MNIYLGCAQWGYFSWVGTLYPPNADPKNFLNHYADIFTSVELNPTYHQDIEPKALQRWQSLAGRNFRFCPKFPKAISHESRLENVEHLTTRFVKTISKLEGNLGPCFIQLPPHLPAGHLNKLDNFLKLLPDDFQIAVELRPDWLQDDELCHSALNILKSNKAGIVIVDSAEAREYINKIRLTKNSAFVRFIAYNHPTDYERLSDWINMITAWKEKGLKEIYFFLHFPEEDSSADFVKWVLREFEVFKD